MHVGALWFGCFVIIAAFSSPCVIARREFVSPQLNITLASSLPEFDITFLNDSTDVGKHVFLEFFSLIEEDASANFVKGFGKAGLPVDYVTTETDLTFPGINGTGTELHFNGTLDFGSENGTLEAIFTYFEQLTPVTFASETFNITKDGFKFAYKIRNWPFASTSNKLRLTLRGYFTGFNPFALSNEAEYIGGILSRINIYHPDSPIELDSLHWVMDFRSMALIDGVPQTVDAIGFDGVDFTTADFFILLPSFATEGWYDPSIGIILSDGGDGDGDGDGDEDGTDGGDGGTTGGGDGDSNIIAYILVPIAVGIAIIFVIIVGVVGVIIAVRKRRLIRATLAPQTTELGD